MWLPVAELAERELQPKPIAAALAGGAGPGVAAGRLAGDAGRLFDERRVRLTSRVTQLMGGPVWDWHSSSHGSGI